MKHPKPHDALLEHLMNPNNVFNTQYGDDTILLGVDSVYGLNRLTVTVLDKDGDIVLKHIAKINTTLPTLANRISELVRVPSETILKDIRMFARKCKQIDKSLKGLVGKTFEIAAGGTVTVLKRIDSRTVEVEHNDAFKHKVVVNIVNLREGNIKNPYAPNVAGHGYFGVGPYVGSRGSKRYKSYSLWRSMLHRAYIKPGNRVVCDEWLDFQVFTKWYLNEIKLIEDDSFRVTNYLEADNVYRPPVIVQDYVQDFFLNLTKRVNANPKILTFTKTEGIQFGYPKCCVYSFINDMKETRIGRRYVRALTHTGYIPCATCDVRYTEQELIDRINENRDSTLSPFTAL